MPAMKTMSNVRYRCAQTRSRRRLSEVVRMEGRKGYQTILGSAESRKLAPRHGSDKEQSSHSNKRLICSASD